MEIFNNMLGSIREPLMVLDADLKVVAAQILGLDRSTLRARMRKLNIRKP